MNTTDCPLTEVALLRLAAQRLVGTPEPTAVDAVRWLTAVQAQDYPGALTSVALRTQGGSRAAVEAALDAGQVVRSWPMRGTLHLVAAEDLPWMLDVLATRVVRTSTPRRQGLGLTEVDLERGREVAVDALSGGRALRRADLLAIWNDAGLTTHGQQGAHLLGFLSMTGTLVLGPTQGREQLYVLLDEWIPRPRRLEREEALGELALRYFRSHGPASVADLARWGNLVAADVRAGVASARPQLDQLHVDGVEHLMDPGTPDRLAVARAQAEGVLLLPGFDELLLGYGDRRAHIAPELADRIVPGGNGMFRPTVVGGGRVLGVWRRTGRVGPAGISVEPFSPLSPEVASAVQECWAVLP